MDANGAGAGDNSANEEIIMPKQSPLLQYSSRIPDNTGSSSSDQAELPVRQEAHGQEASSTKVANKNKLKMPRGHGSSTCHVRRVDLTIVATPEDADAPQDLYARIARFLYKDYYVPSDAIRTEIVAGLIVGLAVVPEAIAFALVVGIPPQWGVDTTLITSLVVGIFGGRPGLCNGASGAVAVVIVDIVQDPDAGVAYMGYTVILAGIFCCAFGCLRLANYMTLISASVMVGFVNALAIIIGCAQVKAFKANNIIQTGAAPTNTTIVTNRRLLSSFDVFVDGQEWIDSGTACWMLVEVAIVMLTMGLLPLIKHKKLNWIQSIPSSLIGILLATAFEHGIVRTVGGTQTVTIGDIGKMEGGLPKLLWDRGYDLPPVNMETLQKILPCAATLAAVALIEQMMTLQLVDAMTRTVGEPNREGVGLGLGNVVAGLFGGMGGNAMIGQSVICIKTGGFRRLSNIVTGLTVLCITAALFHVVNLMPSAAFVGMMWMICYYTFEWNSFRLLFHACHNENNRERFGRHHKIERTDLLVIVVVTVVTLFTNLAMAVAAGIGINLISFAVKSGETVQLKAKTLLLPTAADQLADPDRPGKDCESDNVVQGTVVYEVEGPLFFGSIRQFMDLFDYDGDPSDVELHCFQLSVMDYSATEALVKLADEYKEKGKRLHLKFLKVENHRLLTKARGMLEGISSWESTVHVNDEDEDLEEMRDNLSPEVLRHRHAGQ